MTQGSINVAQLEHLTTHSDQSQLWISCTAMTHYDSTKHIVSA